MEKILNQILSEIQGLKEGQNRIETRVGSLETKVDGLETKVTNIENKVDNLESKVDSIETKVDNLEVELKEIHRKTSIIFDQTVGLTEFKTVVKEDLDELKKEVTFIGHKEYETEKDMFAIKKQLEIIK